jgi:hypothetical protein
MNRANINLHIDTLVLEGLPVAQREQVRANVISELTVLLSEQGLPSVGRQAIQQITHVDAGSLILKPNPTSETVGTQIATQIYQGLSQ